MLCWTCYVAYLGGCVNLDLRGWVARRVVRVLPRQCMEDRYIPKHMLNEHDAYCDCLFTRVFIRFNANMSHVKHTVGGLQAHNIDQYIRMHTRHNDMQARQAWYRSA